MNFKKHSELKGKHATFSPSQSHWLRYDDTTLIDRKLSQYRSALGTELHDFAATQILLKNKLSTVKGLNVALSTFIFGKYKDLDGDLTPFGEKLLDTSGYLPSEVYDTIIDYVNDGIRFRMRPEQPLYYSDDLFGTADTIGFDKDFLRIHDLKTGAIPAHIDQLEVYAALFCLEYKIRPGDIGMELRIYQNGEILHHEPTVEDILPIMDRIETIDKIVNKS